MMMTTMMVVIQGRNRGLAKWRTSRRLRTWRLYWFRSRWLRLHVVGPTTWSSLLGVAKCFDPTEEGRATAGASEDHAVGWRQAARQRQRLSSAADEQQAERTGKPGAQEAGASLEQMKAAIALEEDEEEEDGEEEEREGPPGRNPDLW